MVEAKNACNSDINCTGVINRKNDCKDDGSLDMMVVFVLSLGRMYGLRRLMVGYIYLERKMSIFE